MKKSVSAPNLPSTPSISIAGTASAYVILSNLAPTVSVEDIKVTLAGVGGGVREVHIISSTGQGLQVKVAFKKPEGGRECVAKFNGIKADGDTICLLMLTRVGRTISVAFEKPVTGNKKDQPVSFLNRQTAPVQNTSMSKGARRREKRVAAENPVAEDYVSSLYSDQLIQGQRR